MTRRDCLTPPADGTRNRETYDRFRDFLAEGVLPDSEKIRALTPAKRYRLKFLAWRMGNVAR